MLPGPVGGIRRPTRLCTNPITIWKGVQGASEIVPGTKNVFSGCLTPVPLDRNRKYLFFHVENVFLKNTFLRFLGNFLGNQEKM